MPKKLDIQPKSGENSQMEFRCIGVRICVDGLLDNSGDETAGRVLDLDALECTLNDLHDEAAFTGRVIVSQEIIATTLTHGVMFYTIHAQWVGVETMRQMQRQNMIASGMNDRPRGIV